MENSYVTFTFTASANSSGKAVSVSFTLLGQDGQYYDSTPRVLLFNIIPSVDILKPQALTPTYMTINYNTIGLNVQCTLNGSVYYALYPTQYAFTPTFSQITSITDSGRYDQINDEGVVYGYIQVVGNISSSF